MKKLITIVFFIYSLSGFSQLSKDELLTIDSLKNIIENAQHDSDKVNAYFDWDNIIYYSDPIKDKELNLKIKSICEKNLSSELSESEQYFFKDYLASSLSILAGHYKDEKDYETALIYYNEAMNYYNKINNQSGIANLLNNIGAVYDAQDKNLYALDFYNKSLSKRIELKEYTSNMVSTIDNIASINFEMGRYNLVINNYLKALKIAEKINNKYDMAHIYAGMGLSYYQIGDIDKAIEYYNRGLVISEDVDYKDNISTIYLRLGNMYFDLDSNEKALDYFHICLKLYDETKNQANYFDALSNIGSVYKNMGLYDKSLEYHEQSLNHFKKYTDTSGIAGCLSNIGNVYSAKGDNTMAVDYYLQAYEYTKNNAVSLSFTRSILENLYYVYRDMGKKSEALKMFEKYVAIKDSIESKELYKTMLKQDYEYEYEKQKAIDDAEHEKKIAIEKEKEEKQRFISYATAGGLGLTGIFLFIVFNRLRVTRKQKLIIEDQKSEVETQKQEAEHQRDLAKNQKIIVEEKNKEILESITYAKRIQEAILPPPRLVKEWLTESFIFYKPKDIVAGDFYWMETATHKVNGKEKTLVYFAAADCTGHGVPGAMVSVVCANALNRAIKEFELIEPGQVLDKVTELVLTAFEKSEEDIKDGMDIALCALDISSKKIFYSGANNPLYRITSIKTKVTEDLKTTTHNDFQLIEYKATKQPIGAYDNRVEFVTQEIQLEPGDAIYIFSDGFADQFGGEKGKKYKYSTFRNCLLENFSQPMETQKQLLETEFNDWKGEIEQVDDVCVIGVKINGVEKKNFTKRELEVLHYLQDGLSSKLIADKMHISKHTVDTHRRRLLAKTGTYNATELINYCIKKEII